MSNSDLVFTPATRQAQAERGSARAYAEKIAAGFPDRVTGELAAFIAEQDTAFLGTASADGAPYIQHRGGPKGFIKVVDERTLGFADYRGNRQYITLGNLSENDRAYLFLIDFSRRQRIKLWGRARVVENDDALIARLFDQGYRARPERVILFTIEAWDVNCSQHITARLTEAEVTGIVTVAQQRIAALEAENGRLRRRWPGANRPAPAPCPPDGATFPAPIEPFAPSPRLTERKQGLAIAFVLAKARRTTYLTPWAGRGFTMKSRISFAIALTVSMLATGTAFAQTSEEQSACMDDAFRICSATIPDRARTTACMIQNKTQLSAACQSVMAKYQPGPTAPIQPAVAMSTRNAASIKPIKTAGRPGKPLNILMR